MSKDARPLRYPFWIANGVIPLLRPVLLAGLKKKGPKNPLRISGAENIPRSGPVLLLANHRSYLDPVVLQYASRRPIHYMSNRNIFDMPRVGDLLRFFRAFPVETNTPDRSAIDYSLKLLEAGEVVGIFPEGGCPDEYPTPIILPPDLKPGISLILRRVQVPVICAWMSNVDEFMPPPGQGLVPSKNPIQIVFGETRLFPPRTDREEILGWVSSELTRLANVGGGDFGSRR
jgi:1-acyl-sn-glycerol-3-phosphate acyltransferase